MTFGRFVDSYVMPTFLCIITFGAAMLIAVICHRLITHVPSVDGKQCCCELVE